ncbi:unnamed protein product [Rotaria socialis]|uniref:Serine/threonine-protein kinase D1-3-like ubiquitin-like domain-containing protein n=1 Tax=Rotaria socialis TaxID=392032 RepID=A0A820FP98_9BILA|nr:unnamed protein product [Rotaria socialis]CAF4266206.1 unnamed protein product [Rotaria socialis]
MNPFSSTINTLCEVAIRFIQTMCPDQNIKLLHNRILLFRYDPSSYQMIISLSPKDILIPDTTQCSGVISFNRLLNEFTLILTANGQRSTKIFVPRSIQRIRDTEMVAFVKRVDLEIPENRILEVLTKAGLGVINVTRLNKKDGNIPASTITNTFKDAHNRNTFIHTGLQVNSMHFNADAASQNKTRCGDNHRIEQCTAPNDAIKCSDCKGKHLATANDCPKFFEQEKRMLNLINQYSSTSSPTVLIPLIHDTNEFSSLPNMYQRQQGHLHNDIFDGLINLLTTKMKNKY